jgi:alkylation response protein AidB-like acyl-CoA dehydrogenase
VTNDVLVAAAAAADVARRGAPEAEAARTLPVATVEALAQHGMLTLCLPEPYGGPGVDPLTFVEAIEVVAKGDGAAGWATMIGSTTSSMAAYLDADTAEELYPSTAARTCGVFAPNGRGVREGGGFRVTGRWQWGSGSQHSTWIMGGATCDDGTQRSCFFPAEHVEFHDTWYTSGLRGTGSLDYSVDGVLVPERMTIQPGVTKPQVDAPSTHFPNFTLLAIGIAGASIGIARNALDELITIAADKRPQFSSRTLAASGYAQTELARAESQWRAARAYLHDEVGRAWATTLSGDSVSVSSRVGMRLAAAHAASACAVVADSAFTIAGGSAVYDTSVLGRCLRDAHVVTQHIMVAPKINEVLGRHLMGVEFDARMI